MTIYVPLIYWETDEKDIADVVFHGYYNREDAEMLNPGIEILEIRADEFNPRDN